LCESLGLKQQHFTLSSAQLHGCDFHCALGSIHCCLEHQLLPILVGDYCKQNMPGISENLQHVTMVTM